MKHIHTYEDFLNESILSSKLEQAYSKIDSLPKGAIFDDSKRIDGIFDITKHSWSDVANAFEKNEKDAKIKSVNVKDIQITQRNIQSNKVKKMISQDGKLKTINVVQFPDGLAIYDGHHRLTTAWALGETKIKVNLVKI
jgi:hypothetical protein